MTIPFLDIFRRAKARFTPNSESAAVATPARTLPTEKPTGDRLSKTVMPNMVRSSAPDTFKPAVDPAPNIKLPSARSPQLPPSVALALQPKVERTISLKLSDFLAALPAGYIKPVESFNAGQRILLKACDVEKGMAMGKPTAPLSSIHAQVPDIFLIKVAADDARQIDLPFDKVMDQFQNIKLRDDQEEESDVPQVDTPFLQVTLEDTEKFGVTLPKLQTSDHPPVKVEPATAQALSSAEPEPVMRETVAPAAPRGIPLNISTSPTVTTPRPSAPDPVTPTRIPFSLPPNGTGGSDSEDVPATSSGPPVPTSEPSAPPLPNGGAARIPFKISAPCEDVKPKLTLIPGASSADEELPEEFLQGAVQDAAKISLGLREVLQNMPAFQLAGTPEAAAANARIELPLLLVESQLASGRIAIPMKIFREALPENQRDLVVVDDAESPVLLPLQEVLKNLPSNVLKMRDDQEAVDAPAGFETPFSIKAAEDAKRFQEGKAPAGEAAGPAEIAPEAEAQAEQPDAEVEARVDENPPSEATAEANVPEKAEAPVLEAPGPGTAAPEMAKTGKKLDTNTNAKEIVTRASALPGVGACTVTFEDGLSLAGNLPEDVQVGGLCAMAPSVLQKMNRHTVDTKLGPLTSMTLHCRESQMSFFMRGSVCLTVLHAGGDLASATHKQLAEMADELSRTYSQPETVHVDY
jgi:predicted regulator of Ras-like GTPase activity (Roadblock/LC7/MglB family)